MNLDLFLAGILAGFALGGMTMGAVKQATHWSGLFFGYLIAWPAAAAVTPSLAPRLSVAPFGIEIGVAAVTYLVFYGAGALAFQRLVKKSLGEHKGTRWDRWGGAALGLINGAIVLYTIVSGVLFFERPLTASFGHPPPGIRTSRAAALVGRHNLFALAAPLTGKAK